MLGASWGTTPQEEEIELGCDEVPLPAASLLLHRAVSIEAPPQLVFRWLCQLRLAPYSYDLLDNFARRSPRARTVGLEQLEVGQVFMRIFRLISFEEGRQITLRARRTAVSYATMLLDEEQGSTSSTRPTRTRLLARVRFDPPGSHLAGRLTAQGLAVGDLVMMRKQLMTLRELAEREASGRDETA